MKTKESVKIQYAVFEEYQGDWSEVPLNSREDNEKDCRSLVERYRKNFISIKYALGKIETKITLDFN